MIFQQNITDFSDKYQWFLYRKSVIFCRQSADFRLKNQWSVYKTKQKSSVKITGFVFCFDWKPSKNVRCFCSKHEMFLFETRDVFTDCVRVFVRLRALSCAVCVIPEFSGFEFPEGCLLQYLRFVWIVTIWLPYVGIQRRGSHGQSVPIFGEEFQRGCLSCFLRKLYLILIFSWYTELYFLRLIQEWMWTSAIFLKSIFMIKIL